MAHIAIDIDQTIFPAFESLNLLPERSDKQLFIEDCKEYSHFLEQIGEEALEILRRSFKFSHAQHVQPFEGVFEAIQFLHQNNIDITFLTHRNQMVFEETQSWIKHHNIDYGPIVCHPDNKIDWCLENGAVLLIDDHPDCIEEGLRRDFPVVSLRWPYHHHIENDEILFSSWQEINQHLFTRIVLGSK